MLWTGPDPATRREPPAGPSWKTSSTNPRNETHPAGIARRRVGPGRVRESEVHRTLPRAVVSIISRPSGVQA